jgi:hypothetical protein
VSHVTIVPDAQAFMCFVVSVGLVSVTVYSADTIIRGRLAISLACMMA